MMIPLYCIVLSMTVDMMTLTMTMKMKMKTVKMKMVKMKKMMVKPASEQSSSGWTANVLAAKKSLSFVTTRID